jgi:hypothetical protein
MYGFSSVCDLRWPRKLNLLVKVLPHPGTGHLNAASFLRLWALAACVAVVVTTVFSTCRIGGNRGICDENDSNRMADVGDFGEGDWECECDSVGAALNGGVVPVPDADGIILLMGASGEDMMASLNVGGAGRLLGPAASKGATESGEVAF